MSITDEEAKAVRDCDDCILLEKSFGVAKDFDGTGSSTWDVFDAECVVVARCPTETIAEAVAAALEALEGQCGRDVLAAGSRTEVVVYCAKHSEIGSRVVAERERGGG